MSKEPVREAKPTGQDVEKLKELMKDIKFAMLTTVGEDNQLHSRPMTLKAADFDGDLWFIISRSKAPAREIEDIHQVNVSFADANNMKFISVTGTGEIIVDRKKVEELWNPMYKAWFPEGVNDPDIAALKVQVTSADVWDSPSSKVVRMVGFLTSAITGEQNKAMGHREFFHLG